MTVGRGGVVEDSVVCLRQTREDWMCFNFIEAKKVVYYCGNK